MSSRSVLALSVLAVALGLFVFWSFNSAERGLRGAEVSHTEDGPEGMAPARHPATEPDLGAQDAPLVATKATGEVPREDQAQEPTLGSALAQAGREEAADWAAWRLGQAEAQDPEVMKILSDTVYGGWMRSAPYRASVVLGPSDLPWLRTFEQAVQRRIETIHAAYPVAEHRDRVDAFRREASAALAELASARAEQSQRLKSMLNDTRSLGSLPEGSEERAWLEHMIATTEHSMLWTYPEVMPRSWRQALSARDLPLLSRLKYRVFELQAGLGPRMKHEEWREQCRPLAEELRNHLETRAPVDAGR